MGCCHYAACHDCEVMVYLGYSSYASWFKPDEAGNYVNRNTHRFFDLHQEHTVCMYNGDWTCKCTDAHVEGFERISWYVDFLDDDYEQWCKQHSVDETKRFLEEKSVHDRTTCIKPINCSCWR